MLEHLLCTVQKLYSLRKYQDKNNQLFDATVRVDTFMLHGSIETLNLKLLQCRSHKIYIF